MQKEDRKISKLSSSFLQLEQMKILTKLICLGQGIKTIE